MRNGGLTRRLRAHIQNRLVEYKKRHRHRRDDDDDDDDGSGSDGYGSDSDDDAALVAGGAAHFLPIPVPYVLHSFLPPLFRCHC